ncbi:hypothetical protein CLV75_1695 [Ruegeria conchae]|uniref:Uncharacterized protein n=3 Tax=Ruegeria conchae TaxID=981384 RepID=A0A497ZL28_9RHOB|nr:hypothetical protein CLV75_1695 [Ruegeria conchae]
MAQTYASTAASICSPQHAPNPVVQFPLRSLYRGRTSCKISALAEATTTSLLDLLDQRRDSPTPEPEATALAALIATMVDMAEGTAPSSFYLSSLDPGVGKTTSLSHFVRHLLGSEHHSDVAVLLCFSQLDEIEHLVEEMELDQADFAVFTSKDEVNGLSSTPRGEARILFTTQAMVRRRCRDGSFNDAEVFHFQCKPRAVRVWDETMLPGEVVSITTDQLASLRGPLRKSHPALAELIEHLEAASAHFFICVVLVELLELIKATNALM